jgi:hypothetical protein
MPVNNRSQPRARRPGARVGATIIITGRGDPIANGLYFLRRST